MILITTQLIARKTELLSLKIDAEKRLSKLKYKGDPAYHIKIDAKSNQIYVRQQNDQSKGKYLSVKKIVSAKQIANYDYLKEIIRQIDVEIINLDKAIKSCGKYVPESYYSKLSIQRQNLITPIVLTDEQFVEKWLSEQYEPGSFDENNESEYYTEKNERVRSKSEILIANAMCKFNVPYKYECPLYLEGLGVIHPDFTALNIKRRKVLYWEHLGKMDDPEYATTNVSRINIYEKNGVFKGDRLILTWETGKTPLDVKLVEQTIKHYLLE